MATLFFSGFETHDFSEWDSTGGTPTIETTIVNNGRASYKNDDSSDALVFASGAVRTTFAWRGYFYIETNAALDLSTLKNLVTFRDSSSVARARLRINATEKLNWIADGQENGSTSVPTDQWFRVDIVHDDGAGTTKIYLDGVLEIDGVETSGTIEEFQLQSGITAEAEVDALYYDDIRWDDVATLIGAGGTFALIPDANGADAWDTGGFGDIDDWLTGVHDGDTTEALVTAAGGAATDGVQAPAAVGIFSDGSIGAAKFIGVLKRGGGGASNQEIRARDHTPSNSDSGDLVMTQTYAYYTFDSPFSLPSVANLGSWEIGVVTAGTRNIEATAMAIMVDADPGTPPPDFGMFQRRTYPNVLLRM